MRTSLRLDDDLLIELKKRASKEGLTLSEVVNPSLRQSPSTQSRSPRVYKQQTRDLGRPSFDVTRANAVAGALDDKALAGAINDDPPNCGLACSEPREAPKT